MTINNSNSKPLVSVGIPCYNKPGGLKRTLDCITNQTYKNLEIIVSDNCSETTGMKEVVDYFSKKDQRVVFYRQERNIGAFSNFNFVLKVSNGDFFMWAADDDEWEENFISTCLAGSVNGSSVMTGFITRNRYLNEDNTNILCDLSPNDSHYLNLYRFLTRNTPSLIYGLHKRESLNFVLDIKTPFDWLDSYITMRLILSFGMNTLNDQKLYVAGIDEKNYTLKPAKNKKGRVFTYSPFLLKTSKIIILAPKISFYHKIILLKVLLITHLNNFIQFEKKARPTQVFFGRSVLALVRFFRF